MCRIVKLAQSAPFRAILADFKSLTMSGIVKLVAEVTFNVLNDAPHR
ncbi:hypothetical protein [Paenibacillus glycanilyticus]|nr:hypothetical protein [Paenibacillus glycanilyticus]